VLVQNGRDEIPQQSTLWPPHVNASHVELLGNAVSIFEVLVDQTKLKSTLAVSLVVSLTPASAEAPAMPMSAPANSPKYSLGISVACACAVMVAVTVGFWPFPTSSSRSKGVVLYVDSMPLPRCACTEPRRVTRR